MFLTYELMFRAIACATIVVMVPVASAKDLRANRVQLKTDVLYSARLAENSDCQHARRNADVCYEGWNASGSGTNDQGANENKKAAQDVDLQKCWLQQ